jgi:hypothetical protein
LRAKALESVSDATLAVFSSVFGHFRFNRRGRCSVRGGNAAKQRRPFKWFELELLREELDG